MDSGYRLPPIRRMACAIRTGEYAQASIYCYPGDYMKKLFIGMPLVFAVLSSYAWNECLAESVGDACNPESFKTACIGEDVLFCDVDKTIKKFDCGSKDKSKTCAIFSTPPDQSKCEEIMDECPIGYFHATDSCVKKSDKCKTEGDSVTRCEKQLSGFTRIFSYQCEKTESGKLFYHRGKGTKCYDGYGVCSKDGKSCLEPPKCNDSGSHCEGNVLVTCHSERQKTSDCSAYNPPKTCVSSGKRATCMSEKDSCSTEGEELVVHCHHDTEFVKTCTKMDNGKLYYSSIGHGRPCLNGCDKDGKACESLPCTEVNTTVQRCRTQGRGNFTRVDTYQCVEEGGKKILKQISTEACDNGRGTCSPDGKCIPAESCNHKTYKAHCDGNIGYACSGKKIDNTNCNAYNTHHSCIVVKNKIRCVEDSDACTKEGEEIITNCINNTEQIKICTRAEDGKLYYLPGNRRFCKNYCNSDNSACDEAGYEDRRNKSKPPAHFSDVGMELPF